MVDKAYFTSELSQKCSSIHSVFICVFCAIRTHRKMPPDPGRALISLVNEFGWYISAVLGRRIKQRWIELNPAEFDLAQLCSQKLTAQIHSYMKTKQQCCQQVTRSLKKTRTTSNLSSSFKHVFYINIHDWGQLLYSSSHLLWKLGWPSLMVRLDRHCFSIYLWSP